VEGFPIQPYDLLMLALLVVAAVFGAWKGMAWQIASICSLALSYTVAVRFSGLLAPYFSAHQPWNRVLAMLVLFLASSMAVWIVFRLVAGVIDRVRLKEFDRQMGALLGLAKGAILCLVVTFFAVTLSESTRQLVLNSRSGYYTAMLIQRGTPMMPDDIRDVLGKYIEQLDRRLNPTTTAEATPEATPAESSEPAGPFGDDPARAAGQGDQPLKAWDPQLWQQDLHQEVTRRTGQLQQRLDRSLGGLQQSVRQGAGQLQDSIDEQFDALGRRIEKRPLEPVR